jgi:lysophospholipase L1-like esterase
MKNYKYIAGVLLAALALYSCDVNNTLPEIEEEAVAQVALETGDLNFSKYVAIGASFTAGFSDGALFLSAQENSFPNILASKFALAGGGEFNQPLMGDNIGGFVFNNNVAQPPRLFFNGAGPVRLSATPTTNLVARATGTSFNNFGIPGAKSFHLVAPGYGNPAGILPGTANPYFARMASSQTTTVLVDALAQQPTFFTLSEVGGNDVLSFATSGGAGTDQTGNLDPTTYGSNDITDPNVFANVFSNMITALTANGAKGVVATVPNVDLLPFFTAVPYNALDPTTNLTLKAQVPLLNQVYGALNQVYTAIGQTNRIVTFTDDGANPVVIVDENLPNLATTISGALANSPTFSGFVQSFGLPEQAVPLVANLFGNTYGQARAATADDLLVLPSSSIIGTVNTTNLQTLVSQGFSQQLAGQFSAEGVTLPLADQWVLTPEEQNSLKVATDSYNTTITSIVNSNPNLALVDLNALLIEASGILGLSFDDFSLTTSLVTGGLISLDGIHLTSRGYALMANKILEAMDNKFGSNFTEATNGLAKAVDFPTNYSPALR